MMARQLVLLIGEHALEFQGFDLLLGSVVLGLHFGLSRVAFLVEVVEHVGVCYCLLHGLIVVGPGLDTLDFSELGLGSFRVIPEAGSQRFGFSRSYLFFAGIVVKDTSSEPRRGPSSPLSGLGSCGGIVSSEVVSLGLTTQRSDKKGWPGMPASLFNTQADRLCWLTHQFTTSPIHLYTATIQPCGSAAWPVRMASRAAPTRCAKDASVSAGRS